MKIGWGTGIAIFYTLFVVALLLVLKKSREFNHSLVVEDYYRHDINYQSHYDKVANSEALVNPLKVGVDREEKLVNIQFPKGIENVEGSILFFRPSNNKQDFRVSIRTDDSNLQQISTEDMAGGLWWVKINWYGGSTEFYDEQKIVLN